MLRCDVVFTMRKIVFLFALVFVFLIPWEGVLELPGLGTVAKLVGFSLTVAWLGLLVIDNRFRKPRVLHLVMFLLVLWNAASVFWSEDPARTAAHVMTWFQILVMVFILWDMFPSRTAVKAALQVFVLGEYVAIGTAAYNFFAGSAFYTHYQRFSPSEGINPDGFGFMVVLGIPIAWYLANNMQDGRWSQLLRLVNYAYIPLAFFGLSLSGTRAALIASIPGMLLGIVSLTQLRLWARIAIFLLLVASLFALLPQVQSLRSFQRFETTGPELLEGDLNGRLALWRDGVSSFTERPFLGVGSNMFRSVNNLGKVAHNSFLSVLVELGLVGFSLFAAILILGVLEALKLPRWESAFWLTLLLVWAIGASTLTWEHRKATWLFLTLLLSTTAAAGHGYTAAEDSLPLRSDALEPDLRRT